jgi:aldose 1-epimerase
MKLVAADWELALSPEQGGAVTLLRWKGDDVFRPTEAGMTDLFLSSCFAMLPYANRIAHGVFSFEGERIFIPANHPEQRHPLHGVSWRRPWTVRKTSESAATLVQEHHADQDWPWSYDAVQRLALDDGGLDMTLSITSTDARPMPVSLGFHPYFAAAGVTGLRFEADGVWMRDDECLPTELAAADRLATWAQGEDPRREDLIDNSYQGWRGVAHISRPGGDLILRGTGTPVLHVYTPPGLDFFCAEPTTALPDAVNRNAAWILAPGDMQTIAMSIKRPSSETD